MPLKCTHVISGDLWAGAEVSALHLITELAQREAVEVDVLVLNPGELARRLTGRGIRTTVLPESRLSLPRLAAAVTRRVRSERPDVIHSHRYKENLLAAVAAPRAGAFHVRTAHGRPLSPGRDRGLGRVGPLLDGALADLTRGTWIAVSQELGRELASPRRKVHVVPNGLPEEAPRARRELLESAFEGAAPAWYVGFVGRLERVKRPDRFVEIVAGLPAGIEGREVRGVLVGDGSLEVGLRSAVAERGLQGRVRFMGHRPEGEGIVAALDLLVIPSDHEGLPMVLLEAMRSGVPVVGSAVGGLREAFPGSPWLVPPARTEQMVRAARRLIGSPAERAKWSATLRTRFRERGSIRQAADRTLAVYREGIVG